MQQTLKRYFGETLTEKMLTNEGEIQGDNIWVSISFTDISILYDYRAHVTRNCIKISK